MQTIVLLSLLCIVLVPFPLIAQTYPKAEAYGGLQILLEPYRTYAGYKAEVAVNPARHLAFVGEFGYGTQDSREEGYTYTNKKYTYMAGPRFNFPISRVRIYAQILFGANHTSLRQFGEGYADYYVDATISSNGFAISSGAGVDWAINDLISVRAAQVDWLGSRVTQYNMHFWENHMRYSAGIIFKFGHAGKQ
jgi:hypothetical protein